MREGLAMYASAATPAPDRLMNQASEIRKQNGVPELLDRINGRLGSLSSGLSNLEEKIAPVLRDQTAEKSPSELPSGYESGMARMLSGIDVILDEQIARLSAIIRRVDL